ncbi:uncharacterized protein LOC111369429 isoform X2 [Olea europaea var. sylvestris]|uniref:uncharacterized protein LOC111369429 isoform X2 n=1 Tax=Olea europaea var. sylvestris TaxID=158386 RepID=UPI000C1D1FD5|nr:uncharacterized protein LOC111369429 isoform X2 [Olea europaea var. sylvestris]
MDTMLCDGQMVMYKLEAAEAMASNSTVRGGALGSRRQSQRGKTEISSLEAEKEAQRRHRILANREFARKTIRRREATYAELNRKAANLSLERENLNKEMVVKELDHLKNINECLKAKEGKIEAEEAEFEKELKKSVQVSISKPTNILTFPYNYPSVSPYLWPAIVPPSDNAFGIQGSSHSDITISSQFPIPLRDGILGSFQDQEHATQIKKQGTSLLVVPLPLLSPFHTASTTLHSMIGPNSNPSCSETGTHSDQNYELTSSQKMKSEASNSMENIATNHLMPSRQSFTKSVTSPGPSKSSQLYNTKVEAVPSATRCAAQDLSAKYLKPVILSSKKPGNANASAVARRRRKELIKLSNTHFHHKGSRVMLE